MAESKHSLLVAVKKFSKRIAINDARSAKISGGFRTLGILDCNGCLLIRNVRNQVEKTVLDVKSFEWGSPTNSKNGEDYLDSTLEDCLVVIKNDNTIELCHINQQTTNDDNLVDGCLNLTCDVVVTVDLLKSLLRDRGKDCEIQEVSVIAMEKQQSPHTHSATLLINYKYIVVISLSKAEGPEMMSCFALENSMPTLPIVVPVLSLVQVKKCHSLIFCLFSSGTAIIHHISGDFLACVDIQSYHYNNQDTDLEEINIDVQQFQRKFVHLEVTDDLSLVISSDDLNNIYSVNLDDYFRDNPNHLNLKDKTSKVKPASRGLQYSNEDEDMLVRSNRMSDIACGDRFWKNELLEMRMEVANKDKVTKGFPGISTSFKCDSYQSSGQWFSCIKDIKSVDISSKPKHPMVDKPSKMSKLTGFLLKRKKSESRSITPSSENSYNLNKEPVMSKFSWFETKSLFYPADKWMEEQQIIKLFAASDSLIVWLRPVQSEQELGLDCPFGLVCLFGYGSKEASYTHLFPEPTLMVDSSGLFQPACLLTKKQLCVPSFGVDQNQLVHKVIMYENAALAEALCHINQWDHCVIPLEALQVALKHRQLDTVAFFLKTQENVFTSSISLPLPSPSTTLSPQFFSTSPSSTVCPVFMDIQQTEHVINALVKSVKKNAKQHHNLHFTSQLLQMTLTYLHSLLEDGTRFIDKNRLDPTTTARQDMSETPDIKEPAMVSAVGDCLMLVTKSIVELRCYLCNIPNKEELDNVDGSDMDMAFDEVDGRLPELFEKWESMDCMDVIRDAVTSGTVSNVQAYFLSKRNQGEGGCDGSLSSITSTGLDIMLTSLVNQDVDTAIRIITNLGRDPIEQLHTLCFNTLHRPLRDFLISELDAKGHLTNDEKEILQFIKALESLYITQSFDMAQKKPTSRCDSWTDLGLLKNTFNLSSTRILETNLKTGSLLPDSSFNQTQDTCGGYTEVLLEWVQTWSCEARQRILLERILSEKDSSKNSITISAQALWHYFASRGDWRTMRSWVRGMVLEEDAKLDDPSLYVGDALAFNKGDMVLPPLTRDVYSRFPACPSVVKDVIVDELTRYGLFTTEQLSTFTTLLHHLCRTQTLFAEPHPLRGNNTLYSQPNAEEIQDDTQISSGQIVSLADFHRKFIDYCIRMQFINVLYHYLDFYGLGETLEAVLELKLESDKPPWVDILISFRLAGIHPQDKDSIFRASLSNARILSTRMTSVTAMLNEGYPIMALATLVYGPRSISQAIVPTDCPLENPTWQVEETLLRRSLSSYPKLLTALFPITTSVDGMEPQDITVYQLLQGNSPLEISRMFGWQPTNELALKADMVCEMPHFSLAPLVSQYAHQESLSYSYYLRHGRPSFAFAAFVGGQLTDRCVTRARVLTASKKAYRVAVQHFTDTQITTACVVFTEMLGVDSTGLRVDIQASNRILSHGRRESLLVTDGRNGNTLKDKIVYELISRGSRQLTMLLTALEEATLNLISKDCLERWSFESSHYWSLVVMFCRAHKMDLSTAYLIDCAKADKWLPFVCFAQVGQFPKHQVLEVIENHFSNRHVKEHLCLAFKNVQMISVETSSDETTKKRRRKRQATRKDEPAQVVTPTKDIRAQFYARMGLKKGGSLGPEGSTCPHSSSAEEDEDKSKRKEKKTSYKDSSSATDGTGTAEERPCVSSKSSTDLHERPLDPNTLPDNLFDVLFSCETANIPWRSLLAHAIALHRSLFAVLAACYEESKPLDCICAWLYSTLKPDILHHVTQDLSGVEWHRWTGQDLVRIITAVVKHKDKYAVSLAKVFYIFDPTSPMLHFLRFYESFVVHIDFDNCQKELDLFKKSYSKLTMRGSSVSQPSLSITHDVVWIEEVASLVTQQMVGQCDISYEQGHLLALLAKAMFGINFSFKIPNYYKLHKINEVLKDTKVVVDFAQLLYERSEEFTREIQRVLQSLLVHKHFTQAREYADLMDLPQDPITLKEVLHERESIENSVLWEIKQGRLAFWHKADECFKMNRCNPEIAASFFEAQAEDDELSSTEKSRLLSMALQWYSRTDKHGNKTQRRLEEFNHLEKRIWLCCIRAEMEKNREMKFARSVSHLEFLPSSSDWAVGLPIPRDDSSVQTTNTTELIQPESLSTSVDINDTVLNTEEEFSALERVIGELLEGCHVTQARRLAAHFDHDSQDLAIIMSCINLAQGTRFVDTLDSSVRKLVFQTPQRRLSFSGSGSNFDGIKRSGSFVLTTSFTESIGRGADDSISVDWVQVEDTITAMESLTYYCQKGKKCCARITTCYKIAQTLGLDYEAVVTDKPFNVLHSLLVSGFDSRYKLADAYIKAFDLSSDEVVGFLKDIILLSLRVYCGEELSNGENDLIFNAAPSCDDVIQVIRLCSDQALLGNRLLETAASVARERVAGTGSRKALNLEVELLVRAHECHTIACNMEGITSVLKCGRQLTAALADSEEYRLMVRLLTGIGRFREMSYIFDTLLRHHHFELLCQRGIDKENKLKVALLEYLKRCHPDDDEKYKIVAMHFSMYREIAETWETSATSQLEGLKDQQMSVKPELQSQLTSIMNSFKYATDYYTKEGCFQHSQKCLKYARLVQLQIHLLSSGICVINLDERGLKKFLSKHNHFFEALLVVDAYEKHGSNLWISAVYYHVVVAGDFKYWQDLKSVMSPASVLFVDVANKYKNNENHHSPQVIQNMKKFLTYLPELRVRYRIATDLGFRDVSSAILEGDGGAYLRDIMSF